MGDPAAEPQPSALNTSNQGAFLDVSKDKLSVRYTGTATHENDVGAIQANHPVPRKRLVYYFEVSIRSGGERGSITVGFTDRNFKHGRHPGWEPNSYGYRSDTGKKYHMCPSRGEDYGPTFGSGDVIGAGIHLPRGELFFTKNGKHLGIAYRSVAGHPLFPTLGLHSPGAAVQVNFGGQAFAFDLEGLIQAERQQQAEAVESARVSAGEAHRVVRSYLEHYGYAASLAAFDEAAGTFQVDMGGPPSAVSPVAAGSSAAGAAANATALSSQQQRRQQQQQAGGPAGDACLALRARLRQQVMSGEVEAAVALLRQRYPSLLLPQAGAGTAGASGRAGSAAFQVTFHLACQQFIELLRRGQLEAAIEHGRSSLGSLRGASSAHDATLTAVAALLAYEQPQASPQAYLLAPAQREATADMVNAAVLQQQHGEDAMSNGGSGGWVPPVSALGRLLQQLVAVQAELHELNGGQGEPFSLSEHLPRPTAGELAARQQLQQDLPVGQHPPAVLNGRAAGQAEQQQSDAGGAEAMAVG